MREQLKKLLVKFQVPKKSSEGKSKPPHPATPRSCCSLVFPDGPCEAGARLVRGGTACSLSPPGSHGIARVGEKLSV